MEFRPEDDAHHVNEEVVAWGTLSVLPLDVLAHYILPSLPPHDLLHNAARVNKTWREVSLYGGAIFKKLYQIRYPLDYLALTSSSLREGEWPSLSTTSLTAVSDLPFLIFFLLILSFLFFVL